MPGGYGSAKNGVRLGVFWDSIDLNSDGSQARIVGGEIRIDRDVNISDSTNKLSWSGGAVTDGSDSNINVSGSGAKKIKSVTGQWQDLVYGSTKSASFAASMSGVDYAGGTISESRSVTYPAREYLAPVSPTDLAWTQTSVGNFTLTWTNQATAAAPWTTVVLVRTEVGGATTEIPVSSAASSITQNGMALDKRYTWYLRITNPTSTVASAPTAMTPIPLHSMTLSASSVAIGGSVTFTINKYGSSNLSTIYFIKNGVKTIVWDKQSGTSFTYTFTQADWAAFLPNETSKVFVVGLETFSGTTSLGAQTQNLTVTVPADAPYLPDATAPTRSEQVTVVGTAFGTNVFVKNKSRIRYTWSGSAGASATITKREILITRSWQSGQSVIDVTSASGYMYEEVPTGNGTVTVASRTTDSRGRVTPPDQGIVTFTVYNYVDPVITTFTVTRCDSAGNTNNSGTYVKFTINVAATSVNPGSEANQMQFRIRLLDSSGNETGSDLYAKALNNTLTASLTTGALGGGAYSAQAGYSFRLTLNDDLTNANAVPVTKAASISSEVYPLTIGTNGIAIGKVYNDSNYALDVVGYTRFTNGGIIPTTIPDAANLNNYTIPGMYHQGANAYATNGTNYPIAYAGLLEVGVSDLASNFIYQRYMVYSGAPSFYGNVVYTRGRYNNVWSAWSLVRDSSVPLVDADIPVLSSGKIPSLDASKVTAGVFNIDRIPMITSGNFSFNANSIETVDWNTILTPGVHPVLVLGTGTNGPGTGIYYYVQTFIYASTNVTQMAIPYTNAEQGIWIRHRYNGTWSAWTGIGTTSSNNYGTLSGSGGDQIGGYRKDADGTLMCWVNCRITPVANTATFRTWTFPVAFAVARPAISVTADTSAETTDNTVFSGPSATSVAIGLVRSNTTTTYIGAIAIGRWK